MPDTTESVRNAPYVSASPGKFKAGVVVRTHLIIAACLIAAGAYAQSTGREVVETKIRGAQPATLAEIFHAQPQDSKADIEVGVDEKLFRVEATLTGNQRKVDPAAGLLIRAWGGDQGDKAVLAKEMAAGAFPMFEFEEDGRTFWLLAGQLAVTSLQSGAKSQKMILFVQNIGFIAGEPFPQVLLSGKPEEVARFLESPRTQKN